MVVGRFFTVGLACALLHNAIMIAGDWLGAHYVVAFGDLLHSEWTVPAAQRGRTPVARYALTMSANLPLSIAGMFAFVDLAGLPVAIASPVVTVLLAAFNFLGSRWALSVGRAQSRRQT